MKRLRFWFVGICIWLFLFYNIERLAGPINLASFVYVFAFILALLFLIISASRQISFIWLFLLSLPLYFFLKYQLGYPLDSENIPIIVTEICAIGITAFLSAQLGRHIEAIKEDIARLTIRGLGAEAVPFESGQARIYSEIRRARKYKRPATLLAIHPTEASIELSIHQFLEEAQYEIIKQYIAARVSQLLVEELQDCDIVAQKNRHFITFLPETTQESVQEIIEQLKEKAKKDLKINLDFGWATFPDEAVTFESLLTIAEQQMETKIKVEPNYKLPGIAPDPRMASRTHTKEAPIQPTS